MNRRLCPDETKIYGHSRISISLQGTKRRLAEARAPLCVIRDQQPLFLILLGEQKEHERRADQNRAGPGRVRPLIAKQERRLRCGGGGNGVSRETPGDGDLAGQPLLRVVVDAVWPGVSLRRGGGW